MISFRGLQIEEVLKNCMNQCAAFGIDTWRLGKLFYNSVLVESRTIIEFAYSAGGEANMGHTRDHTATEGTFLA
jgi:hypothetical protein